MQRLLPLVAFVTACTSPPNATHAPAPSPLQKSLALEQTCDKAGPQPLKDTEAFDAWVRGQVAYRNISIKCVQFEEAQWAAMANAPNLAHVESIEISKSSSMSSPKLFSQGLLRLLSSPEWSVLRDLHISDARNLTPTHWDAIGQNTKLQASLRHLSIRSPEDARSPTLELRALGSLGLERLELTRIAVRGLGWRSKSRIASSLQHLKLRRASLTEPQLQALTHIKMPALQHLDLSANTWPRTSWAMLGAWPALAHLRHLDLSENTLEARSLDQLFPQSSLHQLQTLRLEEATLTDTHASKLAAFKWPSLRRLDLNRNHIGDIGAAALSSHSTTPVEISLQENMGALGKNARVLLTSKRMQGIERLSVQALSHSTTLRLLWEVGSLTNVRELTLHLDEVANAPSLVLGSPIWSKLESLTVFQWDQGATPQHANWSLERLAQDLPTSRLRALHLRRWDGPHTLATLARQPETSSLSELSVGHVDGQDIEALTQGPGLTGLHTLSMRPALSHHSHCRLLERPWKRLGYDLTREGIEPAMRCWEQATPLKTLEHLDLFIRSPEIEEPVARRLAAMHPSQRLSLSLHEDVQTQLEKSSRGRKDPTHKLILQRTSLPEASTPVLWTLERSAIRALSQTRKMPRPEILEVRLSDLEEISAKELRELLQGAWLTKVRELRIQNM